MTAHPSSLTVPTKQGFAALGVTVLVFGAAVNTGANLLFLVGALLMSTGLYAAWANLRALSTLSITTELPDLVEAGGIFPARLIVRGVRSGHVRIFASSFVPMGGLLIRATDGVCDASFSAVAPGRVVLRSLVVTIESTWPLHLVRRRVTRTLPCDVDVHPTLGPRRALDTRLRGRGGHDTFEAGQDGSLRDVREYVPGDSPRRVHWRTSARTGKLHVREDHDLARPEVFIELGATSRGPTLERQLELVASQIRDAISAGCDVTLFRGGRPRRLSGAAGLRVGLRLLARFGDDRQPAPGPRSGASRDRLVATT